MASDWKTVVDPVVKKYDLAAKLGMSVSSNAESCAAKATLLRQMAGIIDAEIEWREKGVREWRFLGWRFRLMRDG